MISPNSHLPSLLGQLLDVSRLQELIPDLFHSASGDPQPGGQTDDALGARAEFLDDLPSLGFGDARLERGL